MQALDLNLGEFDGVALEVEGDGQTFKLNLKTADQEDLPECTFQATFDTLPGERRSLFHMLCNLKQFKKFLRAQAKAFQASGWPLLCTALPPTHSPA